MCYTFVEQMAAGNVAYLGKCGYSCAVLAEKVAPLRGSISDRKRLAGGADMHCMPAVLSAEQRYTLCQPLFPIVLEPPRQLPAQAVHRLALHLLCPALAEVEMKRRADQRVLDSIGKAIAVQQIGLLSGS